MADKKRVDLLLVERGMAESRSQAQRLIMAGQVRARGELVHKASEKFDANVGLTVVARPKFVSRGGDKLEAALNAFPVDVTGAICADVGSSTGGFTDCLLQHGAARVYAIDVGKGQLHWSLRRDRRVQVMEGVNARYLEALPEPVRIVTIDAAFISVELLLPSALEWMQEAGDLIVLIKPQFEAGIGKVGRGGIVKEASIHREVLESALHFSVRAGLSPCGLIRSPIRGAKGNLEFLLWLRSGVAGGAIEALIESVLPP